ncbi:MAG: DUF222 domain-containing protein [Nocardioidaceae bacterium]
MSELAAPLSRSRSALLRMERIEAMSAQIAVLESQRRLELKALACEDTPFGIRDYVADELALALAESCGTARRMLDTAQVYASFPSVVGRVGLPLAAGGWSVRHADALLDSIVGLGLTPSQQEQVVALVSEHPDARTPHQVRKAAQAAVMILDPEAAARRYDKAKKDRHVRTDVWGDGGASFSAQGTASQIAMVMASLDALAGPKQPGETRTLDQRRFDAFMDLICGRTQPGQWQAVVVVALETLEGDAQPAEIPGFGLVCAPEAQDALAHAELRRAVVDADGRLVSVDSAVHRPDRTEPEQLDPPHPDAALSLEVEPQPLDTSPEHLPESDDIAWYDGSLGHDAEVERVVAAAMSELERELRVLLDQVGLVGTSIRGRAEVIRGAIEVAHWTHGHGWPDGGPPGGGPSDEGPPDEGPPDAGRPGTPSGAGSPHEPPEPEPPSFDDRQWAESTQDRDAQDAQGPRPVYEREPLTGAERPRRSTSWSLAALTAASRRLRSAAADLRPLDSTAYALPPRLARFIKTRDVTCTFPGCVRLAQRCQNDHLVPHPVGPSSADNTSSECTHHHQAKHAAFTVVRADDGGLDWTTRHGRRYHRSPRPLLRGW